MSKLLSLTSFDSSPNGTRSRLEALGGHGSFRRGLASRGPVNRGSFLRNVGTGRR
jgi:hypothetical protein